MSSSTGSCLVCGSVRICCSVFCSIEFCLSVTTIPPTPIFTSPLTQSLSFDSLDIILFLSYPLRLRFGSLQQRRACGLHSLVFLPFAQSDTGIFTVITVLFFLVQPGCVAKLNLSWLIVTSSSCKQSWRFTFSHHCPLLLSSTHSLHLVCWHTNHMTTVWACVS